MIFFILHRIKNPTTRSLVELFILNNFRLIHFALKSNFENIFRNLPKKSTFSNGVTPFVRQSENALQQSWRTIGASICTKKIEKISRPM